MIKDCLVKNIKTGEIYQSQLDTELAGVEGYDFIEVKDNDVDYFTMKLNNAKKSKFSQIESVRKSIQYSNILFKDNEFSASSVAQANIIGAIALSSSDSDLITWLDVNNIPTKDWTIADLKQLGKAIKDRASELYMAEATLQAEISSSKVMDKKGNIKYKETIEAINTIPINLQTNS